MQSPTLIIQINQAKNWKCLRKNTITKLFKTRACGVIMIRKMNNYLMRKNSKKRRSWRSNALISKSKIEIPSLHWKIKNQITVIKMSVKVIAQTTRKTQFVTNARIILDTPKCILVRICGVSSEMMRNTDNLSKCSPENSLSDAEILPIRSALSSL